MLDPETIEAILIERNVSYLPLPNIVELVITEVPPPNHLTSTSFVMPITANGSVVLAQNKRRGIEFAGGHVEPGETLEQAARREGEEETGTTCDRIVPIGFLRMRTEGPKPEGSPYPHPLSYQAFHAGRITVIANYVENDECLEPVWLEPEDIQHIEGSIADKMRHLHKAALTVLGMASHKIGEPA